MILRLLVSVGRFAPALVLSFRCLTEWTSDLDQTKPWVETCWEAAVLYICCAFPWWLNIFTIWILTNHLPHLHIMQFSEKVSEQKPWFNTNNQHAWKVRRTRSSLLLLRILRVSLVIVSIKQTSVNRVPQQQQQPVALFTGRYNISLRDMPHTTACWFK